MLASRSDWLVSTVNDLCTGSNLRGSSNNKTFLRTIRTEKTRDFSRLHRNPMPENALGSVFFW